MHLIKSHRPMCLQVPQVLPNLIFPYSGRVRGVEERLPVKMEAKKLPSPYSLLPVCQHCLSLCVHAFSDLPFLADIPEEAVLSL